MAESHNSTDPQKGSFVSCEMTRTSGWSAATRAIASEVRAFGPSRAVDDSTGMVRPMLPKGSIADLASPRT